MKKVIVNIEEIEALETGELRENRYYNVLEERDNFYKIENEFKEEKYYDKDFFFRYLESTEEIFIEEYDDLEEYHRSLNDEGFVIWMNEDLRESSVEITTEEEGFIICSVGNPKELLELEQILTILNQFGFNFKAKVKTNDFSII